jgi:hypothetical protein
MGSFSDDLDQTRVSNNSGRLNTPDSILCLISRDNECDYYKLTALMLYSVL